MKALLVYLLAGISAISASPAGGQSPILNLEEATSAQNLSQGGAGLSTDMGQMFYNPAYLYDHIRGRNFSFTYNTFGEEFNQNFFFMGYGWPTGSNKFSIGVAWMGNSGLQGFDSSGTFTETFSTAEFLTGASHIWRINKDLTMGETLKIYYLNYSVASATILSVEAGLAYQVLSFLSLGFTLDNLVSTNMALATETEPLPVIARFQPTIEFYKRRARVSYELSYFLGLYEDYSEPLEHRVGFEFDLYKRYIQARMGFNGQDVSMGVGTFVRPYNMSFSYTPTPYESRYALTLSFDVDSGGVGPFARPRSVATSDVEGELKDFYSGMQNYSKGEYKIAYDNFSNVLRDNPDHKLALEYRRRSLLHLKSSDNWLDEEQLKLIRLHKELARKYEASKNFGDAINEWRQVVKINPADLEAEGNIKRIKEKVQKQVLDFHRLGLQAYGNGDRIKAIEYFNAALKLNPEFEPSKNWLFKIKQEISQEELREIERIEKIQKAEVFYNRGLTFLGQKQYAESIKNLEQALLYNPKHEKAQKYLRQAREEWELDKKGLRGRKAADALYSKGLKNYKDSRYADAIKDFKFALRAYPQHAGSSKMLPKAERDLARQVKPFMLAGVAAFRQQRLAKAEENFKRVQSLSNGENEKAESWLKKIEIGKAANIQFNLREGKKAYREGVAQRDLTLISKSIGHLNEVTQLASDSSAEYQEAKSLLGKAQQRVKAKTTALHKKARKFFDARKYDDAIGIWEEVLIIDAANVLAKKYIAEARAQKQALKSLKSVKSYVRKARRLEQNREYEKALELINQALKFDPGNKEAKRLKGIIVTNLENEKKQDQVANLFIKGVRDYKQRKYDSAIKKWKRVKKLDPQNALVDRYIAQAIQAKKNRKRIDFINGQRYFNKGQWLQARGAFQRAIKEDPKNVKARDMLRQTNENIEIDRQQAIRQGDKLLRESKYELAASEYLKAQRLSPASEIAEKRDNALLAAKKKEEGIRYLKSETDVGLSIGSFLEVLKVNPFDKEASKYINQAKEKGKNNVDNWKELARQAEEKENYKRAYALYVSINNVAPADTEARKGIRRSRKQLRRQAAIPYNDGKEAMALKNYKLAIEKFKQVQAIYPGAYENTKDLLKQARAKKAEAAKKRRASGGRRTTAASGNDLKLISKGIKLYRQGKYRQAINVWKQVPKRSSAYSKAQKYIARARLKL